MNSGLLALVRAGTPAAIALGARETGNPVLSLVKALTAEPAHLDAACLDDPARFPGDADADVDQALIRHRATS